MDLNYDILTRPNLEELINRDIEGTPKELTERYEWYANMTEKTYSEPKLINFCERTNDTLHIDYDELAGDIENAKKFSSNAYRQFFPGCDKPNGERLPYHTDIHGNITASKGIRIFLGSLSDMVQNERYREYFQKDPKLAQKLAKLACYSFALHELDEWWPRKRSGETIEQAKENIQKSLGEEGLNPEDISRSIGLDIYKEGLDDSIKTVMKADKNELFLKAEEESPESILDGLDPELKIEIFRRMGASLRLADFGQILNKSYQKEVTVLNDNGNELTKTNWGAVTLAVEFDKYRPTALPNEWIIRKGGSDYELNWKFIRFDRKYYYEMAKPNLVLGIDYLKAFDPTAGGEGEIVEEEMNKVEKMLDAAANEN